MLSLASTLDVVLSTANITTVDAFADWLLSAPTFIANYIRSEAAAAAVAARHADVGSQPALTSDVVETSVAEAMIAEAMCMLDEAQERERLADERASKCRSGKVVRSSVLLSSRPQRTGQTVPRQTGWRLRGWRQPSTLPCRWQCNSWLLRQLLRMLLWSVHCMSAQRAHRQRHRGTFGVRLLVAGVAGGGEAGVGIRIRRHLHHHRNRRRHLWQS